MRLVFDATVHMRAANLAGVPLDGLRSIDDVKLVAVFQHGHVVAWNHGDHREGRAIRFPALGAAAGVVVGDVALDADLDLLVLAFADKCTAGKGAGALLYAAIDGWVDVNGHWPILLVFDVFSLESDLDLEHDDRTDRLALVHQIESLVDLLELEDMGDHRVDLDLAVHVPVDDFRHVGAAARATQRRALPDPAGHQLERSRGDFLAGFRHPDHHRHGPAAVTGFQRLPHHGGIAGAVEGVIGAAIGQRDQMLDNIAIHLLRIDKMGHSETAAPLFLGIVDIDADDFVGADHPRALDHIESDAAEAEHHHIGARRHLRRIDHRADTGRDTAADVAALVERRVLADFRDRDLRQHRKIRKRRAAHVVEDRLALVAEARSAVGH